MLIAESCQERRERRKERERKEGVCSSLNPLVAPGVVLIHISSTGISQEKIIRIKKF
jgi:hypothetical protein